jgi:hypothetical protein
MSEFEDASKRAPMPRKLVGARRLLIATIGAATVNYAGCGDDTMTLVANLMAAPYMPPQDGEAGRNAPPDVSNPEHLAGAPATPATPGTADDKDGGVGGEGDLGGGP